MVTQRAESLRTHVVASTLRFIVNELAAKKPMLEVYDLLQMYDNDRAIFTRDATGRSAH